LRFSFRVRVRLKVMGRSILRCSGSKV
jgi:hypothetical protein